HARHRLRAREGGTVPQRYVIADPQALAPRLVHDLELDRPHRDLLARLPRPREMLQRVAAERARVDALERGALRLVAARVHVQHEAPRGAGLVVVVARRHRDRQAVERDAVRAALLDHPREDPEALAVGRAAARHAVDLATRADRLAVARLEV